MTNDFFKIENFNLNFFHPKQGDNGIKTQEVTEWEREVDFKKKKRNPNSKQGINVPLFKRRGRSMNRVIYID